MTKNGDSVVPERLSPGTVSRMAASLQSIADDLAGLGPSGGSNPAENLDKENLDSQAGAANTEHDAYNIDEGAIPEQGHCENLVEVPVAHHVNRIEDGPVPTTPYHRAAAAKGPTPAPLSTPATGLPATTPYAAQVLASLETLFARPPPLKTVTLPPPHPGIAAAQPAVYRPAAAHAAAVGLAATTAARRIQGTAPNRRGCNCKRSQCLKLYCDCFAAGDFCVAGCACADCVNTGLQADAPAWEEARQLVLSKNPTAFQKKVSAGQGHKTGCRCKKSRCLKKYCECFHAGETCNPEVCQCEGCRNKPRDAAGRQLSSRAAAPSAAAHGWSAQQQEAVALVANAGAEAGLQAGPAAPAQAAPPASGLSLLPWMASGGLVHGAGSFDPAMFAGFQLPMAMPPLVLLPGAGQSGQAEAPPQFPGQYMFDPMAIAVAAAAYAAHATLAGRQQQGLAEAIAPVLDEQGLGIVTDSGMAAELTLAAAATGLSAAPINPVHCAVLGSAPALTANLSDIPAGADTACSPRPQLASQLPGGHRRPSSTATVAGGGAEAASWPPLPRHMRSLAAEPSDSGALSGGSMGGGAGGGQQHGGKRPRRAASGGVAGAVAAETSDWGLDVTSPPLKRSNIANIAARGGGAGPGAPHKKSALGKAALAPEGDEVDAVSALVGLNNWAS